MTPKTVCPALLPLVLAVALGGCAHTPTAREEELTDALTGTTWRLVANLPDLGTVTYDVTFHADGRLESHSPRDVTPDDDRWEVEGGEITLTMNDGRIWMELEPTPDGTYAGGGFNKRGERWGVTLSHPRM